MQTASRKYISQQTPAWLLCIAFLLSAAFFTGTNGKAADPFRQEIQTCWTCTTNDYKNGKAIVAYHSSFDALPETNTPVNCVSFRFALQYLAGLTQIKISCASKIFRATKIKNIKATAMPDSFSEVCPSYSSVV